jgi:hypothetical protein
VQDGKANRRKIMQRSATHCTFDTLVIALQEQTRESAHLKRHSFATIDDAKRRRINPVNTCNSNTNDDEFLSFDDALTMQKGNHLVHKQHHESILYVWEMLETRKRIPKNDR